MITRERVLAPEEVLDLLNSITRFLLLSLVSGMIPSSHITHERWNMQPGQFTFIQSSG